MNETQWDRFWEQVAEPIRQARRLGPLDTARIEIELRSTRGESLSEERLSSLLEFARSEGATATIHPAAREPETSGSRLLREISSSGALSAEQFATLEIEDAAERLAGRTAAEVVAELTGRRLLDVYRPRGPANAPRPGLVFDDYLLLESLGAGGMGEVFRALHVRMERIVALKVVATRTPRLRTHEWRFESEIKALAKLNNPHVVTAYDAGEQDGVLYLVMEYVDGCDLARLVNRLGPLTPTLALHYLLQAARGLHYAHKQGLIHRDVKPSNMLVDSQGTVKISDLGLAKHLSAKPPHGSPRDATVLGTALGTYSYMSPEQARGDSEIGFPSDIYGLGCTLFFLLIGRPVAEGKTSEEKMRWHCEGVVPSLRSYLPQLPERLDGLFQRMLAKDAADRPQSLAEVIAELQACVGELPEMTASDVSRALSRRGDKPDRFDIPRLDQPQGAASPPAMASAAAGPAKPARATPERSRRWFPWLLPSMLCGGGLLVALLMFWNGRVSDSSLKLRPGVSQTPPRTPGAPPNRRDEPPERPGKPPERRDEPRQAGRGERKLPLTFSNALDMEFTRIPAGQFLMGAPVEEEGSWDDERPRHVVRLTRPFYLGTYEVTRGQYDAVMQGAAPETTPPPADQPPAVDSARLPAVHVTWEDAVEFCRRLSENPAEREQGRTYRLPTEAEWEYACRAGTQTAYHTGVDLTPDEANFGSAFRPPDTRFPGAPRLLEVGSFQPNAFGLFDMHGNALEWCLDRYGQYHEDEAVDPRGPKAGPQRVVRGGGTTYQKDRCRSAARSYKHPHETNQFTGLRVVCEMEVER